MTSSPRLTSLVGTEGASPGTSSLTRGLNRTVAPLLDPVGRRASSEPGDWAQAIPGEACPRRSVLLSAAEARERAVWPLGVWAPSRQPSSHSRFLAPWDPPREARPGLGSRQGEGASLTLPTCGNKALITQTTEVWLGFDTGLGRRGLRGEAALPNRLAQACLTSEEPRRPQLVALPALFLPLCHLHPLHRSALSSRTFPVAPGGPPATPLRPLPRLSPLANGRVAPQWLRTVTPPD